MRKRDERTMSWKGEKRSDDKIRMRVPEDERYEDGFRKVVRSDGVFCGEERGTKNRKRDQARVRTKGKVGCSGHVFNHRSRFLVKCQRK